MISLQDFAVELKTVHLGIDVLQVTEQFSPEIIFCDVLLQKKNGYDVAYELKTNPKTKSIPVILMWSGFMELDEEKFKYCHADAQLEKPFDANTLRNLVRSLVKSTQAQSLSEYLEFPELSSLNTGSVKRAPVVTPTTLLMSKSQPPQHNVSAPQHNVSAPPHNPHNVSLPPQLVPVQEEIYPNAKINAVPEVTQPSYSLETTDITRAEAFSTNSPVLVLDEHSNPMIAPDLPPRSSWNMESFEEIGRVDSETKSEQIDDFAQRPLQAISPQNLVLEEISPSTPDSSIPSQISALDVGFNQSISKDRGLGPQGFKIPSDIQIDLPDEELLTSSELLANVSMHPEDLDKFQLKPLNKKSKQESPNEYRNSETAISISKSHLELTEQQLEMIIKNQSREVIEKVIWKLVPEICDKLIREEIQRLLGESKL